MARDRDPVSRETVVAPAERLAAYLAEIEAAASAGREGEGFAACGEAFGRMARDPGCLAPALNAALEDVLSIPGNSPRKVAAQFRADGAKIAIQFPVAERQAFTLVVCLYRTVSAHAFTAPGDLHGAVLGTGPVEYSLYALPAGFRNDVFEPCALSFAGRCRLAPGERLYVDSARHIAVFEDRPAVYLKLESLAMRPYEWAFDLRTLRAWQWASTSLPDTQLVYAAETFGAIGDPEALAALGELLHYPRHQVRWAALQAYARIGQEKVIPHLEAALRDEHLHVRNAARAALRRLGTRT